RADRAYLVLSRLGTARRAAGARDRVRHAHHRRPHPRTRQGCSRLPGLRPAGSKGRFTMRLKDKVAIITGAASGIGKDIAVVFAREGAKVAIADLNQKAADATAREIDPGGKRAIGVAMDVSDEQQVEAGIARVIEAFGMLDILVSNAGIQIVAPLVEFEF